jgi:O-antigen/teichoic acid export membrane protein
MDFAPARSGLFASLQRVRTLAWRYGTSAIGPVSVSASHFIASLIFLHTLSPADFGAFSFLLIIVPFCMSIAGSLVGAPVSNALSRTGDIDSAKLAAYRKMSLWLAVLAFIVVSIMLRYSEGHWDVALMLGLYGAVMALRWCARCFAYASDRSFNATVSDLLYSFLLVTSLLLLSFTHELFAGSAAIVLFAAAAVALLAYGRTYLREQWNAWRDGDLSNYVETWRDLSRWSLMGVVLTEATANAHAYFVTFVSGTASFALLAVGGLMMRPLSLVLSALTDRERPAIARLLAGEDKPGARRSVMEFSIAGIGMWVATLSLAAVIFIWFPELLLEKGYDTAHLLPVVAIWAGIWAARTLWTPQTVLLQAQGKYSNLARASVWSSIVSLSATLVLLLTAGPVVSLLGVLAGDLVLALQLFALTRPWRLSHA